MSKILILTGSPQRDKLIDNLLAEELKKLGNEVHVKDTPFNARSSVLELKPDIVVHPPLRNQFAYDFVKTLGDWGIGVAVRHIEPSCDKQDIESMAPNWKNIILMKRLDTINLELIWGQDEVDFVKERLNPPYPVVSCGAFVADLYKGEHKASLLSRQGFNAKYKFDPQKKNLLISSPWGLMDIESDRVGQSSVVWIQDKEARTAWLKMACFVAESLSDKWNILITLHPDLDINTYQEALKDTGVYIDITTTATELLKNSDLLIHSGSTLAIEMHWLDRPSLQFGDVNMIELPDGNWWQGADLPISKVSQIFKDGGKLVKAITKCDSKSNANINAIKDLEKGRYGSMDGQATKRAAKLIDKIKGKFKFAWPPSPMNYNSVWAVREPEYILQPVICLVCDNKFYGIKQDWLVQLSKASKTEPLRMPDTVHCPYCSTIVHPHAYVPATSNKQEFLSRGGFQKIRRKLEKDLKGETNA